MNEQQGQRLFSTITDLAFFATITIFGIHKIIGEVLIGTLLSSYAAYRFGVAQGKQQAAVALGNAISGGGGGGPSGPGGGGGGYYVRPSTGTSAPSMPAVRAPIVEQQRTGPVEYVERGATEAPSTEKPSITAAKTEVPRAERPSVPGERLAVRGDVTRRLAVAPIPADALPSDPPPPSVVVPVVDTVATPTSGPAATTGDPNQPVPEIEVTESGPRRISTGVMNALFNLASGR